MAPSTTLTDTTGSPPGPRHHDGGPPGGRRRLVAPPARAPPAPPRRGRTTRRRLTSSPSRSWGPSLPLPAGSPVQARTGSTTVPTRSLRRVEEVLVRRAGSRRASCRRRGRPGRPRPPPPAGRAGRGAGRDRPPTRCTGRRARGARRPDDGPRRPAGGGTGCRTGAAGPHPSAWPAAGGTTRSGRVLGAGASVPAMGPDRGTGWPRG